MIRYTARRLGAAVPLVLLLSLLVYVYVRMIPGDPIAGQLGPAATPELVASLRAQYGLDTPIIVGYVEWLGGLFQGDLGISYPSRLPVAEIIPSKIVATVQLAIGGLIVGLALALPLGYIAGKRPGSRLDRTVTSGTLVGLATPAFWTGTIILLVFALRLRLAPSQGYVPLATDPLRSLQLTILPALTLGVAIAPYLARLTRSAVARVSSESFLHYARIRGISSHRLRWSYQLRNVWPSLVTAIGLTVGFVLTGSIIVEQLFNWPGTGRLMVSAVVGRDYSMVQALILLYGLIFIIVNLATELIQSSLDPRIRAW